jgi:hypothetical protein
MCGLCFDVIIMSFDFIFFVAPGLKRDPSGPEFSVQLTCFNRRPPTDRNNLILNDSPVKGRESRAAPHTNLVLSKGKCPIPRT